MSTFTTDQAVHLTAAQAPQIDYFVRVAKIITPVQPASRRGVSHRYDLKNLIEITVSVLMLNSGIHATQIGAALTIAYMCIQADRREGVVIQSVTIGFVTTLVTAGLLVVVFLDHPYADQSGSVEPTEMRRTLELIDDGSAAPCDERGVAR